MLQRLRKQSMPLALFLTLPAQGPEFMLAVNASRVTP